MKIILATPIFPPESGGPGIYVTEIARRMKGTHECVIVTYSDSPIQFSEARVVAIPKSLPTFIRWWRFTRALMRELKDADLVYAQNAVAAGFPSVIAGMLARKPVIIKFVGDEAWERARQEKRTEKELEAFLREPDRSFKTKLFMAVQRFSLRHTTLFTTPSAYLLEVLIKTYGLTRERAKVNFNAHETGTDAHNVTRMKHRIITVARLTVWKKIDGVILAVAALTTKYPDISLVIAGDGPERKNLEELVRTHHLEKHVTFFGNIPKADVMKHLRMSHVFVLNSLYEGMPHSVLESFAAGTPVVATNTNGTNEVVTHEKTGLLIAQNDTAALATALERMFTDNVLLERVALNAHDALATQFSWERHIKTLEIFFTGVVTKV